MLQAGLPVTVRGQHRGTPLHWAAWHGNLALVKSLLKFAPPLEDSDNDFGGTPLGWAIHGSEMAGIVRPATTWGSWKPCSPRARNHPPPPREPSL